MLHQFLEPHFAVLEGRLVGHTVHEQRTERTAIVATCQRTEPLLTRYTSGQKSQNNKKQTNKQTNKKKKKNEDHTTQ
jgi:hypothetical protein